MMSKFVLLLAFLISAHTYVSAGYIPPSDLVRFATGDSSLNLTSAIVQKDWGHHFQRKIDFINRLLEIKYGAVGLVRSLYTTENLRFLRNLVGFGVTVGNKSLDYIPDEAVPVTTLITRALTSPINKLFQLLSPPDQSPNDAALESYEVEDIEDSPAPAVYQPTAQEVALSGDDTQNVVAIQEHSGPYPIHNEGRIVRSVEKTGNNQLTNRVVGEANEDMEILLTVYKNNEELLNAYRDRVIALDRIINKSDDK